MGDAHPARRMISTIQPSSSVAQLMRSGQQLCQPQRDLILEAPEPRRSPGGRSWYCRILRVGLRRLQKPPLLTQHASKIAACTTCRVYASGVCLASKLCCGETRSAA